MKPNAANAIGVPFAKIATATKLMNKIEKQAGHPLALRIARTATEMDGSGVTIGRLP